MKCSSCEAKIDDKAIFCPKCGSKLFCHLENSVVNVSTADISEPRNQADNNGVRGKSQKNVHTLFFYNKAKYAHELVQVVDRFLESKNLETQVLEANAHVIVQGKKKPNIVNKACGLDQAITMDISVENNDVRVTIGGAKWFDKAIGAGIGIFVFAPIILTAGWGTFKQKQLLSETEKEIEKFFSSRM